MGNSKEQARIPAHRQVSRCGAVGVVRAVAGTGNASGRRKAQLDMTGLIRGKRLVWVRDGNIWRAQSQFGNYFVHKSAKCQYFHWDLSTIGDDETLNEGQADTLELGQAACQADHDSRAMASVEVVPFEWKVTGNTGRAKAGELTIRVSFPGRAASHFVEVNVLKFIPRADRDAAITAAERFVRQLVMGVPK